MDSRSTYLPPAKKIKSAPTLFAGLIWSGMMAANGMMKMMTSAIKLDIPTGTPS